MRKFGLFKASALDLMVSSKAIILLVVLGMPRRRFECNPLAIYHITARTNNREPFSSVGLAWKEMGNHLFALRHFYEVKIFSFVLMPNHFHLLAQFPSGNASTAMKYFMEYTSRSLSELENSQNHKYGARFYRSEINSYHYYLNAYKYVYRNPVRAGLCQTPEEYPWSTLRGLVGMQKIDFPVEEDLTLFSDINGTLSWLRRTPETLDEEAVRMGLRRQKFCVPRDPKSLRTHRIESRLI